LVTVTNMGTTLADTYTVKIYQVLGQQSTEIGAIASEDIETLAAVANGVFSSHTYHFTPADYNAWWGPSVTAGDITLRVAVNISGDVLIGNDTRTAVATLKPPYDLALASVTNLGMFPVTDPMQIVVENTGRAAVLAESYKVELFEVTASGDELLKTFTGTDALAITLSGTQMFEITATELNAFELGTTHGTVTFKAVVTSTTPTDLVPANNFKTVSGYVFKHVVDVLGTTDTSYEVPLNLQYNNSLTQSLYTSADFTGLPGEITHINYKVNIEDVSTMPDPYLVSIYMANTNKPSGFALSTDWVTTGFTCVVEDFDLPIHSVGVYDFWIPLDTPFAYAGGELVVMMHSEQEDWVRGSNEFFCTEDETNDVSLSIYADNETFNPLSPSGTAYPLSHKPQMRFAMNVGSLGVVSGTIYGTSDTEITGATAFVEGLPYVVTTESDGEYELLVEVTSEARLVFTATGYSTQYKVINTLDWNETDSVTYDVNMVVAPQITVKGTVTFVDTENGVNNVIVHVGQFTSNVTGTNGEYQVANVYANAYYLITVDVDVDGYKDYSETIYIDYTETDNEEFVFDIVIVEDMKPPIAVTATNNIANQPVIKWYSPYSRTIDFTLCEPGYSSYPFNDPDTRYLAAHRYNSTMLNDLRLHGADLVRVGFRPAQATGPFTIYIWSGANLATPNISAPTYTQEVTQALTTGSYNNITLNTPFPIPASGELVIGILSPVGNGLYCSGDRYSTLEGFGNLGYIFTPTGGNWSTLATVTSGSYYEHWYINGLAMAPANPNPAPGSISRAFDGTYNVYRMLDGTTFEEATLLTESPITGGTALHLSFTDETITAPENYYYAVTTVYVDGDDVPYEESVPTYSNSLAMKFTISGTLTSAVTDSVEGLTVNLINQTTGGFEPDEIDTLADGVFSFQVLPGTYQIRISRYSEVLEETLVFNHPTLINATVANQTGINVVVPQNISDDDLSVPPVVTTLRGNYPNPFNPTTTISFDLAQDGHVAIDVYNIKGQRVQSLANDIYTAGRYSVVWNGDDATGRSVGSGVYFYRMTTVGYTSVQKMLLLK